MADNTLFDKYGLIMDSGKIIFKENEIGDKMYIIQEGNVRISREIGGKEHILAVLSKGDFFGEMAIVTQVARTATATAVGKVKLLSFDREGFISMIEKNARIALNIIDKLCRRLQQANLQIKHLVKKNEKGLVTLNLYYIFSENGMEQASLDLHKTTRDLALLLELPIENVTADIENLKKDGIISVSGSILTLQNKEKLISLVENTGKKL
jgi:CRP/FNR family cyclic AMP-dependent transcriptional regulator